MPTVAGSQLLVLTLWFSASAVAPQLKADWGLTSGETAGLTLAVQIGFVLGALGSAVLGVADVVPARRLFLLSAFVGAGANAGKTITYANVVRKVKNLGEWQGQAMTFPIDLRDPGRGGADCLAILVQDGETGRIIGATRITLDSLPE